MNIFFIRHPTCRNAPNNIAVLHRLHRWIYISHPILSGMNLRVLVLPRTHLIANLILTRFRLLLLTARTKNQ